MTPIDASMTLNVAAAMFGLVLMAYGLKLCLVPESRQLA